MNRTQEVVDRILAGEVLAAARFMRELDDGRPEAREILKELYRHSGRAHIIGITGSPGVGKSTLTDRIIHFLRQEGQTVGVVAVDPTSPFSGGAILGDRIRMQRHALDEGVFIRSLATRGHFGGLTASARAVITVLDAMGKDYVLVETVGVGQDEVEIAATAYTTVVVTVPGMGDDIQAIKAGILEVADILVINKADREGASRTYQELIQMLELLAHRKASAWKAPVLMTQANRITDHPDPVVAAYIGRDGRGISYRQFKELYDAFNDTIREVGRKNQVMVIDLAREVPPDKKYLYDLVHFNDAGSQLAAGIIAARLKGVIAPH